MSGMCKLRELRISSAVIDYCSCNKLMTVLQRLDALNYHFALSAGVSQRDFEFFMSAVESQRHNLRELTVTVDRAKCHDDAFPPRSDPWCLVPYSCLVELDIPLESLYGGPSSGCYRLLSLFPPSVEVLALSSPGFQAYVMLALEALSLAVDQLPNLKKVVLHKDWYMSRWFDPRLAAVARRFAEQGIIYMYE
ncbi:hypothetical protein BJX70DRAFT_402730 [Aspergillus crustosus]